MKTPYTREKLVQDFTELGIEQGDTLFIHDSHAVAARGKGSSHANT